MKISGDVLRRQAILVHATIAKATLEFQNLPRNRSIRKIFTEKVVSVGGVRTPNRIELGFRVARLKTSQKQPKTSLTALEARQTLSFRKSEARKRARIEERVTRTGLSRKALRTRPQGRVCLSFRSNRTKKGREARAGFPVVFPPQFR